MKKKFKHAIFNLLQGIEKSSGKAKTAIWLSNVSDSYNRGAVSHLKHMEQPALSEKQKKDITDYWKGYGIRIKDFSQFQWYYGKTGIEDPRFIPQDIWKNVILPYYNRKEYEPVYKNKYLFDTFLPKCSFPKTIVKRADGLFYDKYGKTITEQQAVQLITAYSEVIVKNATDTGQGKNVAKYTISSTEDATKILSLWKEKNDYLVQEVIQQHPFFAQFNESSVNIIRFNSLFLNDKVYVHTPVLRFGLPGHVTDCAHINGEEIVRMVGIHDDGEIRDKAIHLNGDEEPILTAETNPIKKVPSFDKILQLIDENARQMPYFRVMGWDITVDKEGTPIVVEFNIHMPSSYGSQITNGPMWGEDTSILLSFLESTENQKKYIPSYYKLK